ncbi:CST complex subunit STN1 isoform X3 [Pteronotus mesoamericanus]|uniref:CST complex subunit STN1 isoform X3 n=1 Tax=Pteronotus mesoamericanus TaxID=1884717 RepID=UPI0023ED0CD8|nr:CST complex subunit STN1 isoform X3 [Pteronotus parnellii mesoamericanus]
MQSETSGCEEETPSLWWGLDPVFLAFAKLYIRDILDLKESRQVPGVFFYNGHPIKQVDILGTVIGVREKNAFYSYGVDDSTGVINCICWKKLNDTESSPDKVDDPVCNTQIARMLELPSIYRKVYDQPFQSPALEKEALSKNPGALNLTNLTCLLSEKAKEFLVKNRVQTFYQQELETVESLLSLANQPVIHSACSEQADFKNDTTTKAIHSIFKNAIKLLQEKGFIYQKDGSFDNLFYVTREDKELHRKIHRIIQEDCQKPNHMEKGCHFRHILACARLSISPGLSEPVLQQVLEFLEDQSDIVSTMERYYTAF